MNTVTNIFVELLIPKAGTTVEEDQLAARTAFPECVEHSEMHLWRPGQPVAATGRRLLVGAATYSVYDLKLLDLIQAHLTSHPFNDGVCSAAADSLLVDVFDILDCRSLSDLEKYLPGIGAVSHTPVVGLWVDGELVESGFGYDGRMLVYRTCGLSETDSEHLVFQR